jgi:uncharacterized protein YcnI
MKIKNAIKIVAVIAVFARLGSALAHIVLQDEAAAAGASYRAAFRVGHGCDGSATTGLTVTLPDGFTGAQPMPKPGWTVTTRVGKLVRPYQSHGKSFTEGVQEIRWVATAPDNYLPDAYYDEFVLRGTTPAKPGPLWFKVVQTCEKGSNAWVEVPVHGTSTQGLQHPAALLEVLDIQAATGHSH